MTINVVIVKKNAICIAFQEDSYEKAEQHVCAIYLNSSELVREYGLHYSNPVFMSSGDQGPLMEYTIAELLNEQNRKQWAPKTAAKKTAQAIHDLDGENI